MAKRLINTGHIAVSAHSGHPDANRYLIKVKSVKNAILESYFEQLYRICTKNLQFIDNQLRFYSAWASNL